VVNHVAVIDSVCIAVETIGLSLEREGEEMTCKVCNITEDSVSF
jgi:hypothetical protein